MRRLKRLPVLIIVCGIFLLAAGAVQAQRRISFAADLSGSQVSPPNASTATGFVVVQLVSPTEIVVSYSFNNLGGNAAGAHIHGPAASGANGATVFNLAPQATTIGGQTLIGFNVTPTQVTELKNGLWYFDVHSTNFPNGELRGQIKPSSPFVANLSGQQVVPPVSSGGLGSFVYLYLNGAQNFYFIEFQWNAGPGDAATNAFIRGPALPGANGSVVRTLGAVGNSGFAAGFANLSPLQLSALQRGQYYVEVTTTNFPAGALRGQLKPLGRVVDFDGDNRADISVWRGTDASWHRLNSAGGAYVATSWGTTSDIPIPSADFDADGRTDLTIWRRSTGDYYSLLSATNTLRFFHFGQNGDEPRICADYDGDGVTDYAVYRQATTAGQQSVFYIYGSVRGFYYVNWGLSGDRALIADWDGDRVADITIYRLQSQGSYWGLKSSNGGAYFQSWGLPDTDWITTGDVDGDGRTDPLVFRFTGAQAGIWYALGSTSGVTAAQFGVAGDDPVAADYDGDGKTDFAVYRGGTWWILRSGDAGATVANFGLTTDYPIPLLLVR